MKRRSSILGRLGIVGAMAMAAVFGGAAPQAEAAADPVLANGRLLAYPHSADGSYVQKVTVSGPNWITATVYSAAMHQAFPVQIQRPADTSRPRPTLYMLNGAGGGVDGATWRAQTDVMQFLSDKNVNVVTPIGGMWAYYTDWKQSDPVLGLNKWTTFINEELPPLIDAGLGTNGLNALAGLSMAGTSVLNLAEHRPGHYKSVAAYSGCAQTADPVGQEFVKLVVQTWGGGNVLNMYGPDNDPMWAANDPYIHAEKLRGTALYISSGSGLPGQWDTLNGPHTLPGAYGLVNQAVLGGIIEAGVNYCTHNLMNRLNSLGIPATYDFPPVGTHSWGYWEDEMKRSWPVLAGPLGIS